MSFPATEFDPQGAAATPKARPGMRSRPHGAPDADTAARFLEVLFERDPLALSVGLRLALHYLRSGDRVRAADVYCRAAITTVGHGAHARAMDLAMLGLELHPAVATDAWIAMWCEAAGRPMARALCERIGRVAAASDPQSAGPLWRVAAKLDPSDAEPLLALAHSEAIARNRHAALAALERYVLARAVQSDRHALEDAEVSLALALTWWPLDRNWRDAVNSLWFLGPVQSMRDADVGQAPSVGRAAVSAA